MCLCCIATYIYKYKRKHNQTQFKNFNERTNTLLYKNMYLSHTLFSMFLWCVRDGWRQGQTAILTQLLLLTISALLPHLGWGCSTRDRWGPQPSVCKLALTPAFLYPTNSTAASTCLYSFIMPTCFRFFFHLFTQVHLWLMAQSRVNIQHLDQFFFNLLSFNDLFTQYHVLFFKHFNDPDC